MRTARSAHLSSPRYALEVIAHLLILATGSPKLARGFGSLLPTFSPALRLCYKPSPGGRSGGGWFECFRHFRGREISAGLSCDGQGKGLRLPGIAALGR